MSCCRVPFAVYISDDCQPDLQYIPDTHRIIAVLPPGGDPLAGSMTLLRESVESNAAVAQFEVRPALLNLMFVMGFIVYSDSVCYVIVLVCC